MKTLLAAALTLALAGVAFADTINVLIDTTPVTIAQDERARIPVERMDGKTAVGKVRKEFTVTPTGPGVIRVKVSVKPTAADAHRVRHHRQVAEGGRETLVTAAGRSPPPSPPGEFGR